MCSLGPWWLFSSLDNGYGRCSCMAPSAVVDNILVNRISEALNKCSPCTHQAMEELNDAKQPLTRLYMWTICLILRPNLFHDTDVLQTLSFCLSPHSVRQWAPRLHAGAETGWRGSDDMARSPREIGSNRSSFSSTRQVKKHRTRTLPESSPACYLWFYFDVSLHV